ncbi:ComEA family DNA-binding protein [Thermocatellispora tengchongensis]|uniref:ComEA family DNA-binding protein n=1 Tax=Thermocatellispora tengchongensis TaxID=1073253 RepID=UPI003637317C
MDTLPGVGEVLARRIVDYRESHGGFRDVAQLQDVSGIGDSKYADLKDKVTV